MKRIWMYLPFVVLMACGGKDEEAKNPEAQAPAPLSKSQNSEVFNAGFENMLGNYFMLKDGLVKSNKLVDPVVDSAAKLLIVSADSLKLTELKADEAIISTAKTYVNGIAAEAKGLIGEKELENKRKSFQMISDQLYDLIRTVRYDRQVVYHQFCPMAFNDQGAYWLSRESEIRNPYFANKMLHCGEVSDSLDFRAKQ